MHTAGDRVGAGDYRALAWVAGREDIVEVGAGAGASLEGPDVGHDGPPLVLELPNVASPPAVGHVEVTPRREQV